MRVAEKAWFKALVVVGVLASVLVPSLAAPARTIERPATLARSLAWARVTGETQARFAFEATHLAFSWIGTEGTGFRFRVQRSDGTYTRWSRAHEAHDAERGVQHYSSVISTPRASAVEFEPIRPQGAYLGAVTLDYLNTLDGPKETFEIPATAAAAASDPNIITRARWGADESLKRTSGGCQRVFYPVQQLFVHHTAGANFDTRPAATMRAIYWYHVARQGWCDIGYNFVIAPDGRVFEGRWARSYAPFELHDGETRGGRAVAGAHVASYNSGSIGISLMGNYSQIKMPPAMRRSLAEMLAWEADRHGLPPKSEHTYRNPETGLTRRLPYIAGHRDAGETACPGGYVYTSLKGIRRDAAAVIGEGKLATQLTLASPEPIQYGSTATFTGQLLDENGAALADRRIRSFTKAGGDWTPGPTTVTAFDGSYALTFQPERKTRIVAVYDGDATTWGAESPTGSVAVAPTVTLRAEGGSLDAAGVTHFGPGTTAIRMAGEVVPAHAGHTVRLRVSKLQPDGTYLLLSTLDLMLDPASAYVTDYELPDPGLGGTYRALTWFPSDGHHKAAASNEVFFFVDPG